MKLFLRLLALAVLLSLRTVATEVPVRVPELARTELATLASDPVIVEAIKARNASGETLEAVKAHDEKWMKTPGVADFMKEVIDSPAGQRVREWRKTRPYLAEIIVMDNLGANVAITEKTSDYWQGDEKKFTEPFRDGGKVFVDAVKFDDSTQTYSVQVSVPVLDHGTPIGAICFGIDIEQL